MDPYGTWHGRRTYAFQSLKREENWGCLVRECGGENGVLRGKMKRYVSVGCSFRSCASTADETEDESDRTCEKIAYNGVLESL